VPHSGNSKAKARWRYTDRADMAPRWPKVGQRLKNKPDILINPGRAPAARRCGPNCAWKAHNSSVRKDQKLLNYPLGFVLWTGKNTVEELSLDSRGVWRSAWRIAVGGGGGGWTSCLPYTCSKHMPTQSRRVKSRGSWLSPDYSFGR
jgi:hypothetical protein